MRPQIPLLVLWEDSLDNHGRRLSTCPCEMEESRVRNPSAVRRGCGLKNMLTISVHWKKEGGGAKPIKGSVVEVGLTLLGAFLLFLFFFNGRTWDELSGN